MPKIGDQDPLIDLYHRLAGPIRQDPIVNHVAGEPVLGGSPIHTPFKGDPFLIGSTFKLRARFKGIHMHTELGVGTPVTSPSLSPFTATRLQLFEEVEWRKFHVKFPNLQNVSFELAENLQAYSILEDINF